MELIEILSLDVLISLSPINDERPLPKPFLLLKGFIMLHSLLVYLYKNSSVNLKYVLLPDIFCHCKTGIPCDGASDNLTFLGTAVE